MLEELDGPTTDAIVFSVAWGWMIVEAGHSICLADVGRRLMEIARLDGTPMTRAHARSALKFPDFYANISVSSVFSYALLQIEPGSFNRYARLGER